MPIKKRSSTRRRKPSTRYSKKKRSHKRSARDVIYYNPRTENKILPQEYFTKITSKYSGTFTAATFSASGLFNSADLNLDATNTVTPFHNFPAAGITWMDSVSPLALPATSSQQLFGPALYAKQLVYKTKVTWFISPSVTSQNDSIIITCVPTLNNTAPPGTVTTAMKQPYVKFQEFRSVGCNKRLDITVDWPKFIGDDRKDYMNDINDVYANTVTVGGVYSAPARSCFINTCIQTLDCTAPGFAVPFTYIITHYIKMSEYVYSKTP